MGMFLAVSAFRDVTVSDLVEAIVAYLDEYGVGYSVVNQREADATRGMIDVHEPVDGWTTVAWPEYFNVHDVAACRALSHSLDTVVSAMSVADDDGWSHSVFGSGKLLDKFHSYPVALVWELSELEDTAAAWAGRPDVVAAVFGVRVEDVEAHYRQAGPDGDFDDGPSDPTDPWGFVELWEVLGITYPQDVPIVARLDMADGWDRLLPVG